MILNNTIYYLDIDISKTPYNQQLQKAYSFQGTMTKTDQSGPENQDQNKDFKKPL